MQHGSLFERVSLFASPLPDTVRAVSTQYFLMDEADGLHHGLRVFTVVQCTPPRPASPRASTHACSSRGTPQELRHRLCLRARGRPCREQAAHARTRPEYTARHATGRRVRASHLHEIDSWTRVLGTTSTMVQQTTSRRQADRGRTACLRFTRPGVQQTSGVF